MKSLFGIFGAALLIAGCSDSMAPVVGNPDPVLSDLGTMGVGDVRTLTFTAASGGLTVPSSMGTAQYAVILGNSNVSSATIPSYTVRGDWLAPSGQTPVSDVFPAARQLLAPAPVLSRGEAFEAGLRNFERTRLPRPAAARAAGVAADRMAPHPARAVSPPPPVGSTINLKVLTADGFDGVTTSACASNGFVSTVGVVKYVSQHAVVVSDVSSPAGGFSSADFQAIGDEFDQLIYPTDVGYFGTPTDIDNNGHIIIYYTPAVNKLTAAGQAAVTGYVGGFFFAGDLYPPTAAGCLSSNQAEVFYLLAPDPAGVNGNSFTTSFVRQVTRGTVAHEFQHMINSGNRYVSSTAENFEATWMDEGLAHFAEDAVGRAKAGFADNQAVSYSDIQDLDESTSQAFFLQNFARAKYYVERPDTTGAIVSQTKAGANLASRGAEWAMLRYAADWFNVGGDPRTLTRKLVAGPDTGTVNLVKATGVPMDTILARFVVTLYTDHQSFLPAGSPYSYKSYELRDLLTGTLIGSEVSSRYLPVGTLAGGSASVSASVPASSGAYFLSSESAGGARTIRITDSSGNSASDANGRVYVVRVR